MINGPETAGFREVWILNYELNRAYHKCWYLERGLVNLTEVSSMQQVQNPVYGDCTEAKMKNGDVLTVKGTIRELLGEKSE